ncbi:MAG: 2-oxoglutarate dehydrogenase E1 subunit family protein, partial [Steroidobacteraceae bacterium]
MSAKLRELLASSPLSGTNAAYVEDLYERFREDPGSVPATWRDYFRSLGSATGAPPGAPRAGAAPLEDAEAEAIRKQGAVSRLIQIYANRGHLVAYIDPLGMMHRPL